MKNEGELVLEALHALRAVYGNPSKSIGQLVITGDSNAPSKPSRAIGTAWVLGKFDPKLDMRPIVHELVIYRGFSVYRKLDESEADYIGERMSHRKGLAWFVDDCWPEYLQNSQ